MTLREIFAANLKAHRKAQGLSQEDLAHRADLDRTYISALERQLYSASLDVIEKLAAVLAVPPAALLRLPEETGPG
ncbi:MAG: helix-turn-helix transcriptional regulator [Beijerinckiaceae bacterium]|nr:helix-turn-helix transcriptional regulator [Beijerinckiaceae bacterium]